MQSPDRALVLGPGGPVGTAWLTGLLLGLRRHGVDLAEADLTVGTSAGAIVGATLLADGPHLERLASPEEPDGPPPARPDAALTARVFGVLGDRSLAPEEARRRVGRLALDGATPDAESALLTARAQLIGTTSWPERRLLLTAVDASTGLPAVWDRDSDVPLVRAVAASSAFPGAAPPVTVHGAPHIDGALRAGANTDLAADARLVVVLEPMSRTGEPLRHEPSTDGSPATVTVSPDAAALTTMGPDPADLTRWDPTVAAGLHQAATVGSQ
ncbi:patatin-like phospholipase family protein, partial [Streptacidiphilus pinicola]